MKWILATRIGGHTCLKYHKVVRTNTRVTQTVRHWQLIRVHPHARFKHTHWLPGDSADLWPEVKGLVVWWCGFILCVWSHFLPVAMWGGKRGCVGWPQKGAHWCRGGGGQNPTGQRKYCVRNTARWLHILFLCSEANKYCINLYIFAWKVHMRMIGDFNGVSVCNVTDWSRGVFLLFQSWDIWH